MRSWRLKSITGSTYLGARTALVILLLLTGGCCSLDATQVKAASDFIYVNEQLAPEPASQITASAQKVKLAQDYLAVTANPYATAAATKILAEGGSAIDAAIAAQMVLGLVEPQSSGLGGGGFLLFWDAKNQQLSSYDGRETAPLGADENLFLKAGDGQPVGFVEALIGGRSVGVPGMVHMLGRAHDQHGIIEWPLLFDDAIELAENGFTVSERLSTLIKKVPALRARPQMARYLYPDGQGLLQGGLLKNKDYALSLKTLAAGGPNAFYYGAMVEAMVAVVGDDANPGQLSMRDFSQYQSVLRKPVCKIIFAYRFCGMGPPSSGATTVLSILAMLESLEIEARHNPSLVSAGVAGDAVLAHAFIEASRLAFADRNKYLADPDFVSVPVVGLLEADYLSQRASMIDLARRSKLTPPGSPSAVDADAFMTGLSLELPSTTHLTIMDASGNIVSMTNSIETAFGSRLMSGGFILNNQLTDFSFAPIDASSQKIANRVQGGKRPLSSMSPMIVFDTKNQPVLALGSPGGRSIISYVARVLYEVLVLGQSLPQSVAASHVVEAGNKVRVESAVSEDTVKTLGEMGHVLDVREQTSGIHAIYKTSLGWQGVADPRREGTASGQ